MILIAQYEGKIWAGVYMLRAETVRLVSVRLRRIQILCRPPHCYINKLCRASSCDWLFFVVSPTVPKDLTVALGGTRSNGGLRGL
jgi:hypothetical protein